jgi:hypothetical protein
MRPRHLPKSIGCEIETFHLPHYRLADDALARRKFAVRIALEPMKFLSLRDFFGVDAPMHGGAKAFEIRRGSRWNIRRRLPNRLIGN